MADFISAMESYESKDYSTAYEEFISLAELGEKRAQFNLGVMYYYGQHVEKNINTSYAWMKLAVQSDTLQEGHRKTFKTIANKIENLEDAEAAYYQLQSKYSTDALLEKLYPVLVKPKGGAAFNAKPISIVEPKWPNKALRNGISGLVRVNFDIDKTGAPRNIAIIDSFPDGLFTKASLKAVAKWKFEPAKDKDGKPVIKKNMNYTMEFQMNKGGLTIDKKEFKRTLKKAEQGDAVAQFKLGFWAKKASGSVPIENPNEWFLKSAIQGVPAAQYEIGQSLIKGTGCISNQDKGIEWLTRAAANGEKQSRTLLGKLYSRHDDLESQKVAKDYFGDIENMQPSALVDFLWMLIKSPYKEINDPMQALELSEQLNTKDFRDEITEYEIKAAAYAKLGNFKKAIRYQEDAIDEAEDLNADLSDLQNHLTAYKNKQLWF